MLSSKRPRDEWLLEFWGSQAKWHYCLRSQSGLTRVGLVARKRRRFMMNHTGRLMSSWMGGGIWLWALVGIILLVLLVVLIIPPRKK